MSIEIAVPVKGLGFSKQNLGRGGVGGVVLPLLWWATGRRFGGARACDRAMTGGGAPLKTSGVFFFAYRKVTHIAVAAPHIWDTHLSLNAPPIWVINALPVWAIGAPIP